MKISRVSDEQLAPSWVFETKDNNPSIKLDKYMSEEEIARVKDLPSAITSEAQLIAECDNIEKCSSAGSSYYYNSTLQADVISHLKEYAMACGMDMKKCHAVHPERIEELEQIQAGTNEARQVTASVADTISDEVKALQSDPFKMNNLGDASDLGESDWQDVHKQANLGERPSMASGAIKSMRGGEDLNINSFSPTARGQNSITNPDAIETYAKSEKEDDGARLKRVNEAKVAQREQNSKDWEQGKIDAMEHIGIIPKGKVFPTEVMNAQPGLNTSASRMANINASDIPEKTQGEMLVDGNEERRQSIQREESIQEPEKLETASVRGISDEFTSSLKAALNK